jgi:hypothetical protein
MFMIYEQIFADLCQPIFSTQLPRSDLVIQKLSAKAIHFTRFGKVWSLQTLDGQVLLQPSGDHYRYG